MRVFIAIFFIINILFANELKYSTSPYLLQHKDNPVDWMEWSPRAFKKAKKEHKLIFLSIGYSTCHWCHVMSRESFSKKDVAKVLNKYYVSIKVDRERKSDLDSYYQLGYRLVNGRGGGWPLNVVLLPNKKPIFFATYMPKDILIETLKNIALDDRKRLYAIGNKIDAGIKKVINSSYPKAKLPHNLAKYSLEQFKSIFDYKNKGFSGAPKFPQASSIDVLLNIYAITKNKDALNLAISTLKAMAKGGIYDQIEGGFFRYSVDSKWQIPHFEKMLYTNAELISVYSKAYKITKEPIFAQVVKDTISNVERYFQHNGLYYSASNADSKNEDGVEQEGYYYVYEYDKVYNYLIKHGISKSLAKKALKHFGIEPMGNFEGGDFSNPHLQGNFNKYKNIRNLLAKYRKTKEYPFIDKKINTAWNALYIKSLYDAKVVDKKYAKLADKRVDRLLSLMYKNNEIYHQTLLPHKPTQKGLLEDYVFVSNMLFSAYENSLQKRYLDIYNQIVKKSVKLFYHNGNWYASRSKEFRVKASFEDGGYKSPVALHIKNLLLYSAINGDYKIYKIATNTLKRQNYLLKHEPQYYATLLDAALMLKEGIFILKGKREFVLKFNLDKFIYPYLYRLAVDYKEFQICGLQSCFVSFKNFNDIEKELKKLIKNR